MNILNIDGFAKTKREVVFAGVTYAVEELSVQQFIDNMKAAEEIEASGVKSSVSESFEKAIASISESIPTLPVDVIRSMKLPVMTAILQFLRGDLEATEGSGSEGAEEKKPT